MMRRITRSLVIVSLLSSVGFAQLTDLSGLKICIDPGHGGHAGDDNHVIPDPGTDFWESENNFQTALQLKALLEAKGAIVLLTRNTNDYPTDAEPSLSARVTFANQNNVHWFHSIHTDATSLPLGQNLSTNSTLLLIREKVVPGGDAVYGPGTGQPETQEAWNISAIIGPNIVAKLRTQRYTRRLDWTFYGSYTLGILRGLTMPGELSEAAFHDYYPETRRLMNNRYLKMEAYALRDAFLSYFGVPADSLCIVAGILSEPGSGKLIDASRVRLLPEDSVYTGDSYHNGFYMFDGIKPGTHTVRFETPGYHPDSVQITLAVVETRFLDKQIETFAAPAIVSSTPAKNDTAFSATGQIKFTFSKIMDTASVRAAFSITPAVRGNLLWSSNLMTVTFKPDSVVLPFNTSFVVRIDGIARSQSGYFFDGNGDGTSGDAFEVSFRTQPVDAWPPALIAAFAANGARNVSPNSTLNFTYDEPLDPASVNSSNIVIQEVGGSLPARTFEYNQANGRGGFNIYPQGGLKPGKTYRIRISGVKDLVGNAIPASNPLWTFTVASTTSQFTTIEDFSSVSSWYQPLTSGSTTGVDSGAFAHDTLVTLRLFSPPSASGRLTYRWNTATATDWLLREYLLSGPGRSVIWEKPANRLQVYLFGDGSGTQFRFAVDDSMDAFPDGNLPNHEVNLWIPIDWVGWRLVEWDMASDSVGSWVGNGKLEGMMRFDSFQLRYTPSSKATSGNIYFAQLRVAKSTPVFVEHPEQLVPGSFELLQNYPNPFNPTTVISYHIAARSMVSLKVFDLLGREITTLTNGEQAAGKYTVRWDGKNERGESVSSGVYIYQLRAGTNVSTRKMVLLK